MLAGMAAGLALVALAVRAVRRGPGEDIRGRQLAAAQVAVFAAMEVLERGGSIQAALSDRAVRIGLLLQLAIGLLLALVVRLFERTVAAVAAKLRRSVRRIERTITRLAGKRHCPRPVIRGTLRLRSPPRLAFS
ncbi:MAG: hypothetical protein ACRDGW_07925 [Actinomycetota bacterium]